MSWLLISLQPSRHLSARQNYKAEPEKATLFLFQKCVLWRPHCQERALGSCQNKNKTPWIIPLAIGLSSNLPVKIMAIILVKVRVLILHNKI